MSNGVRKVYSMKEGNKKGCAFDTHSGEKRIRDPRESPLRQNAPPGEKTGHGWSFRKSGAGEPRLLGGKKSYRKERKKGKRGERTKGFLIKRGAVRHANASDRKAFTPYLRVSQLIRHEGADWEKITTLGPKGGGKTVYGRLLQIEIPADVTDRDHADCLDKEGIKKEHFTWHMTKGV